MGNHTQLRRGTQSSNPLRSGESATNRSGVPRLSAEMALHVLAYNLTRVIKHHRTGPSDRGNPNMGCCNETVADAMCLALAVTRRGLLSSLMPHSFDTTETRSRSRRRGLIRQF